MWEKIYVWLEILLITSLDSNPLITILQEKWLTGVPASLNTGKVWDLGDKLLQPRKRTGRIELDSEQEVTRT